MLCPTRYVLSLIVIAALAAPACSGGEAASDKPANPANAGGAAAAGGRGRGAGGDVPVTIATVERKSMPIKIEGIGTVIAASTVAVHAQITGTLTEVHFVEGQDVKQGQVLVSLDRRPLEAALQQAQATLDRDIAQSAYAKAQSARTVDLQNRGIATKDQADQSTAAAAALDATVNADRANVENAKVQLDYATITSPLDGRTGLLQVHPGNLVRATDTQPIVTINKISPVYVSFSVPEAQLPALKRFMAQGQLAVSAHAPEDTAAPSMGRITFIDNAVDPTTGQIKVKGTFPNTDLRLWPGQFVQVSVTLTSDPDAISVPSAAVQTGQQGDYAFVVKPDQTVELRPVVVERTARDWSVIRSGLQPGETVVTDGQLRLVPGSRITVKPAAGAPAAAPESRK
ncbi:MAG TPA: efflux RND transporter periplasmic adaptor subunit [Vicinamibacterales bacterium]|nr:efflux RND transporter periplasmic adaptor subunit [Vicinamibacterales bacterium]